MEDNFVDDIDKKKSNEHVTRNVLLGLAGIFLIALILFIVIGETGGKYAYVAGLIIGIWSLPVQSILLGLIFFIAKKKAEGGVMLIIGFVLLLIGLVVCGPMMF